MDIQKVQEKKTPATPFLLFGLGAIVGAVVALLYAPDKGVETRRKLGAWIKEKKENGKEAMELKKAQVIAAAQAGRKAYEEADKKVHS